MDWSYVFEKDGSVVQAMEGTMPDPPGPLDPYTQMNMEASRHPGEKARVSVTVQRSLPYGEIKVSFTLAVSCPQTKPWIDHTSQHIFSLAVLYVNGGMAAIAPGLEPLPVPPTPQ